MFNIEYFNGKILIKNIRNFDLEQTLDCGQAFRWCKGENGVWHGIAGKKYIEIYKENNDIVILNSTKEDFENFWYDYFDLECDYGKIINDLSTDDILKSACSYGSGIRILRQEPWEALCSFIISQNNNIPRIKGIIERLCENFGEKCGNMYTFPDAEKIADLSVEDLSILKCGFRARYIIDAAKKVASGHINLEQLKSIDTDSAREKLMSITGVGPKVADCTLLFGLYRIDAFPKDVWIKRAMENLFPNGLPECAQNYLGIVQQYIFYYSRSGNLNI